MFCKVKCFPAVILSNLKSELTQNISKTIRNIYVLLATFMY
jgi:hypothetical protein